MTTCASCGRQNEDHYKYCLGCGANLDHQRSASMSHDEPVSPRFCPSCGSDVSAGQRFCGACGFKLEASLTSGSPSGSAPVAARPASGGAAAAKPAKSRGPTPAPPAAVAPPDDREPAGSLVMVNPDGSTGDSVPLFDGPNTIGRNSEHEVLSRDPFLSPVHTTFDVAGGEAAVTDENSLNGVFYRITDVTELQHGDQLRIGQELLRFLLLDLAEPIVQPSDDGTVLAGSNPRDAWGTLERFSAPDTASVVFTLGGAEVVVGRERGDILFRDDGYVSGKHARLFQANGRYFVEDLNSSNGTFVRIRGRKTLEHGALILLGRQPFRLQLG